MRRMVRQFSCGAASAVATKLILAEYPPKLSRSKLRYMAWLDADCGMTFKEWITYKPSPEIEGCEH